MAVYRSQIRKQSEEFVKNSEYHSLLARQLEDLFQLSRTGGGLESRQRHERKGKRFVRDRVSLLLDSETAFLELSPLVGWGFSDETPLGGGIVTGLGCVQGQSVMVIANDATSKGGTYFPLTVKKHLRALEIALEHRLPCYYLVDSGGAYLPLQADLFPDRDHFGRLFYYQSLLSSRGIPQIALVLGSCTAGGAYVPVLSDQVIMVRGTSSLFLAGPPLVEAATGEKVSEQDLGGAELHCRESGVADFLVETEEEAFLLARRLLPRLSFEKKSERVSFEEPLYPAEELAGILPRELKHPLEMREVLARLVDGSYWEEFKPFFGPSLFCGWAEWWGLPVGILANQGILTVESAHKAVHFIQLCVQRGTPLLFLQNITGFLVGQQAEAAGIAKAGAKMVQAVTCAPVPKYTLLVGGSYGAGNYGMCGRAYQPRFLWSWPHSRISVMGGDQAAQVLSRVRGKKEGAACDQEWIRKKFSEESQALYGTARLWDDGILLPSHTRETLGLVLHLAQSGWPQSATEKTSFGIFRL